MLNLSNRELAKSLIDQIPENKVLYVIAYLQGAIIPDEASEDIPNEETLSAIAEVDEMKRTGGGQHFNGSSEEFMQMLLTED